MALPPVAGSPSTPTDQAGLRVEQPVFLGRKPTRPKVAWRTSGPRYIHAPPGTDFLVRHNRVARAAADPMNGGSIMTTHLSDIAGTPPSASTNTTQQKTCRPPSPWSGVAPSKLREALAELAKATKPSSPAIDFGRYVRREVDRAPDSAAGVLAMAKFLRLDPVGKAIEKLEAADYEVLRHQAPLR
jgi:hypothetical protein